MLAFAPFDTALDIGHAALAAVSSTLAPVGGVTAAIVVLTIAIRLSLSPLRYAQFRAQRAQAALAPRLRELATRHRDDPQRLQRETADLYRAEGISPLAGCLPALLQAPVLTWLYQSFATRGAGGGPVALPGHTPFGVGLDRTLPGVIADPQTWAVTGLPLGSIGVFVGLLGLLTLLAWWSGRRAAAAARTTTAPATGSVGALVRVVPFLTVGFATFAPLAIGVYLLTSTAFTTVEDVVFRRRHRAP